MCIRVYSTRRTSVCAKDNDSLAPTAKWGLPFILEWSELYELRPGLYEPLFGPDGYRRRPVDRSNSASSGWLFEAGCNYSVTTLFLLRIVSIRLHVYYEKRRSRRSTPTADRYTVKSKAYQWLDRRVEDENFLEVCRTPHLHAAGCALLRWTSGLPRRGVDWYTGGGSISPEARRRR